MEELVGGIRSEKRLSVAGRVLLLVVLSSFLGWGFWLMRSSRRELIKMAHYDLLTDLPNRRLFFDRLENRMARSQRNNTKIGLFFVDLAGLNAINDRHGHHGGDLLLVKMAKRLQDHLRDTDNLWDELREKCFHNKVFSCLDALEDDLVMGLLAMENTPEVIKSITNWPWIIDVLSKWK